MAGHDDKTRVFTAGFVQAAEAPQERDVTDSGEGTHVEVTTDEVDGVVDHVLTQAQESGRGLNRT